MGPVLVGEGREGVFNPLPSPPPLPQAGICPYQLPHERRVGVKPGRSWLGSNACGRDEGGRIKPPFTASPCQSCLGHGYTLYSLLEQGERWGRKKCGSPLPCQHGLGVLLAMERV